MRAINDGLSSGQRWYRKHVNNSPRPYKIEDGLNAGKRWYRKHINPSPRPVNRGFHGSRADYCRLWRLKNPEAAKQQQRRAREKQKKLLIEYRKIHPFIRKPLSGNQLSNLKRISFRKGDPRINRNGRPKSAHLRKGNFSATGINRLSDYYIRFLLARHSSLSPKDFPPEIVELQRSKIRLLRTNRKKQ